jgi:hypothetical protein
MESYHPDDPTLHRIITTLNRNIFLTSINHIYNPLPFKALPDTAIDEAVEAAMSAWETNLSRTKLSAKDINTGDTLTLVDLIPVRFGTYEDLFRGLFQGKPFLIGLTSILAGKFPFVDEPYIGIEEQSDHLKLGDKIVPWIAYQLTSEVTISDALGVVDYPTWASSKVRIYQEHLKRDVSLPASEVSPFCVAKFFY